MTKDEAIDVEAERDAFITAYRLWCYSTHPDSRPEMALAMAESHWGRAAGAMWLAAKRSIAQHASEAVAEKPQDDRNAASPAATDEQQDNAIRPSAEPAGQHNTDDWVLIPRKPTPEMLNALYVTPDFVGSTIIRHSVDKLPEAYGAMLAVAPLPVPRMGGNINAETIPAAQPAADPAPVPAQGIDHAKLADELADLLFALILCVKNGDDPKPRTKAIQEYVAGIAGQARGQQAGVPEAVANFGTFKRRSTFATYGGGWSGALRDFDLAKAEAESERKYDEKRRIAAAAAPREAR